MALKELLVHLNQAESGDARLRLAIDLASRHASHLTALFVDEWNDIQMDARATAEMGLAEAPALAALDRSVTTEIHRVASRLRHALEDPCTGRGVDATWHQVRGFSKAVIQRFVPCADLCILGHEGLSGEASSDSGLCESLVISAGTPLLFIPKSAIVATLATRIVVAWDSSRAATRALNDSIPLIERADKTLLLNVDSGRNAPPADSLKRVTERLRRHCLSADFMQIQTAKSSIAKVVQAKAHELGADLIVCGAFGHSRLRENLFGGVTRELLDQTQLPLLLSH
jgi:nucleotide-binding universal stress UspA family protein